MTRERGHLRPHQLPGGRVEFRRLVECQCVGAAELVDPANLGKGWTRGRRGPAGGVCGACGGAIPEAKEANR